MKNRIKELRLHKGYTLEKLAEKCETSYAQIQRLEKGSRRLNESWIEKLCEVFNIRPGELFDAPTQTNETDANDRLTEVIKELSLTAEEIAANTTYTQSNIKRMMEGSEPITEAFILELERLIPRMESGELVDYVLHYQKYTSKLQELNRHQLKAINALIEQMIGEKKAHKVNEE